MVQTTSHLVGKNRINNRRLSLSSSWWHSFPCFSRFYCQFSTRTVKVPEVRRGRIQGRGRRWCRYNPSLPSINWAPHQPAPASSHLCRPGGGAGCGAGWCEEVTTLCLITAAVLELDTRQLCWQETPILWSLLQHYSRYHGTPPGLATEILWNWNYYIQCHFQTILVNIIFRAMYLSIYLSIYTVQVIPVSIRGWRWLKQNM